MGAQPLALPVSAAPPALPLATHRADTAAMPRLHLRAARLLVEGAERLDALPEATLVVEGGRILAVEPGRVPGLGLDLPEGAPPPPGLAEPPATGGGGRPTTPSPPAEAALAIADAHRRFGVTTVLPTLITDTPARMREAAATIADAVAHPRGGVGGLHLEGPFLSPLRPGVHDPALIRPIGPADHALIAALAARVPVLLTLAPEHASDSDLTRLAAAGVRLCAGHSAAPFERAVGSLSLGVAGFTHWPNAMPPLAGRDPGIMGAALASPGAWCGVIVDGVHVHPATLRLLLAGRPAGRVVLVSDAMPPAGTALDRFTLGGRTILRRDGRLETEDGVLAGADLDLAQAVRNAVALLGVDGAEALRMASTYPAHAMRLHDRGRLAPGLRADLVLLGADLRPVGTWVAGSWRSAGGASTRV